MIQTMPPVNAAVQERPPEHSREDIMKQGIASRRWTPAAFTRHAWTDEMPNNPHVPNIVVRTSMSHGPQSSPGAPLRPYSCCSGVSLWGPGLTLQLPGAPSLTRPLDMTPPRWLSDWVPFACHDDLSLSPTSRILPPASASKTFHAFPFHVKVHRGSC